MDCLFCNIVNRSVNSYIIYEDDICLSFLDAFPNQTGHTLIVPKKHYDSLDDIDEEVLSHIMSIAKILKKRIEKKLEPNSIILINNTGEAQKIKHFHLHLIPNYKVKKELSLEQVYDLLKSE